MTHIPYFTICCQMWCFGAISEFVDDHSYDHVADTVYLRWLQRTLIFNIPNLWPI